MDKRTFLKTGLVLGAGLTTGSGREALAAIVADAEHPVADDSDFWKNIRKEYKLNPEYINLENGYYSMQSQPVFEKYIAHLRELNLQASKYMRGPQFTDRLAVRDRLAELLGCSSDELIITRNTTESLDTVISGFDWKAGDEAIMAEQDYGAMLDMFRQQAKRYGIVNKMISVPNHPIADEEIVELYEKAITPKTRLLMVCHMINITGQILPVRKIADMAQRHGVQVMVDGAHAFAHIQFDIRDLNCDYYGASLHKWLGAPLGCGILYVKKDRIKDLWPIYGDSGFTDEQIRKLNHTGTHPVATDLAIGDAIDYHLKIGAARKEERLRHLQRYWTTRVRNLDRVVLNTPEDEMRSCAIANVGIDGLTPAELQKELMEKYKIWTVAISGANVHGVRITPHLYTTESELDSLVKALSTIAGK